MPSFGKIMLLGTSVAIFESGRILLTQREDFEVWCLPGGKVENGESIAQAAIREVREETGLDIRLTRLVGIYSRPLGAEVIHNALFAAKPIGGTLTPQPGEVIDLRYFSPKEIGALPLFADHQQRIGDAFKGIGGSAVWWHDWPWPESIDNHRDLYALRDASGLSRREFYQKHFKTLKPGDGRLEIDSDSV